MNPEAKFDSKEKSFGSFCERLEVTIGEVKWLRGCKHPTWTDLRIEFMLQNQKSGKSLLLGSIKGETSWRMRRSIVNRRMTIPMVLKGAESTYMVVTRSDKSLGDVEIVMARVPVKTAIIFGEYRTQIGLVDPRGTLVAFADVTLECFSEDNPCI